jgi:ribosome biogenesis GTPase
MNRWGLVVRARSRSFTVSIDGDERVVAVPKRLRFEDTLHVDPVAVGDRVDLDLTKDPPVILTVAARRNGIARPALGRQGKLQLVAANLDRAVLVMAAASPPWKPATLDRYLVLVSAAGVPPLVCWNKEDLDPASRLDPARGIYARLGIPSVSTSTVTGEGLQDLGLALAGETCVFLGPSGVGKSSLINRLVVGEDLRVGEVSARTNKGRHTTAWVEMVPLPRGGRLVDSPGLRVLDLTGVSADAVAEHFPEVERASGGCRFGDCRHRSEPGCAVKAAVESGEIAPSRYDSYLRIGESLSRGEG